MKIVNIVGPVSMFDQVARMTGGSGQFQPENAVSFYRTNDNASPMAQKNPWAAPAARLEAALPAGATFAHDVKPLTDMSPEDMLREVESFASKMEELGQRCSECESALAEESGKVEMLSHFTGLSINMKEITKLERLNPAVAEYSVQVTYLQLMLELPWNDVTQDNLDLKCAREQLDHDHFGLDEVKERLLEHLVLGCAAALFDIHFLVADADESADNGVKVSLGIDALNNLVKSAGSITNVNGLGILSCSCPMIACCNCLSGSCVYSLGCRCCVYA